MGNGDAQFELVEPFDIDDGSLSKLRQTECFALGVEWAMFRAKLIRGHSFTDLVMENNAGRLTKMAERAGRFVEARPADQGWALITVGNQVV